MMMEGKNKYHTFLEWAVPIFFIYMLLSIFTADIEPTNEQIEQAIQCNIDFCESQNLTSTMKPKQDGYVYVAYPSALSCFGENNLEFDYRMDIYQYCNITLEKNWHI